MPALFAARQPRPRDTGKAMSSPAPPKAAVAHVEHVDAATALRAARKPSKAPMIAMAAGTLVIVVAITFLIIRREPETGNIDFAVAFACPPGVEARRDRMKVTASTLNVRAAPNSRADRMPDRTLRKHASVTEECRSASWSRVRLADGRSGWVANQYLTPISRTN